MKEWVYRKIDELFGIDTRSLAAMRVGFALIVLYDFLFERFPHLTAHYGNAGVFPSDVIKYGIWFSPWPSLFTLLDRFPYLPLLILSVGTIAALFLLVGWRTRIASVLVWIAVFLIQLLNPIVLQGGDILLRLCLFIGMFLPWGLAYSIDSALTFEKPRTRHLSAWTAAFMIQLSFMYLFAITQKTGTEWTTDGTAVYYALSLDQFSTPIGEFTRQFPVFMMFLTFGVVLLQGSSFFLLFSPLATFVTRSLALSMLLLMHLSFALHMNLGPFSWIAMTALLSFVPTRTWDWIGKLSAKRFGNLTIYFDGDCGFCKKSSHLIRTFFLLQNTEIIPAQANPTIQKEMEEKDSWVVVTNDTAHHYTYSAGVALLRASPILFWIAPLFAVRAFQPIGEKVYRFIATHRKRVCLPDVPRRTLPSLLVRTLASFSGVLAAVYIVAVASWNYSNIPTVHGKVIFPNSYSRGMREIGLDQWWNMFSPYPLKEDGWYAIAGVEENGTVVNMVNPDLPVPTAEKPKNVSALYPDERWRKYLMNMWGMDYQSLRPYYLRYLCRDWNSRHAGIETLKSVSMTYMLEETLPNYETAPVNPIVLGNHTCEE